MIISHKDKNMQWNLDNIRFLYPPDDFTGTFANAKMQERHKASQDQKIKILLEHLKNQDRPQEAMLGLHQLDHLQFLQNNLGKFRQAGQLEETVLMLYYKKNSPFAAFGEYGTWRSLLAECDPARLCEQGKPFPFNRTTAFRGSVTGNPKGLSWTVSRDEAAWFLERWKDKSLGGGTVFATEITRQEVMVYIEDEHRREVILFPEAAERAVIREIERLEAT